MRDAVRMLWDTEKFNVAGHDIGLMVAYAYAATYPQEVHAARADGRVSYQASPDGAKSTTIPTFGTSDFTDRRRLRWSPDANARTSTITGTTLPPIPNRSLTPAERESVHCRLFAPRTHDRRVGVLRFLSEDRHRLRDPRDDEAANSRPVDRWRQSQRHGAWKAGTLGCKNDVTVVVLENTGHWLMEESPQQTIAALTKVLDSY